MAVGARRIADRVGTMILYLDCANGVSGDMLAAALLDLAGARPGTKGPLERVVRPALKAAGIDPRLVRIETVMSAGIEALSFRVADAPGFATFDELILAMYASGVDQGVADDVAAVAERMAAAEREVHGEDRVHLHELSGVDTAADLISVAVLLRHLGAERVLASPPALGDGVVHTAHGELPVPAPAVAVLVRDLPVAVSAEGTHPAGELTTPTGAALLAHFATGFGEAPAGDVLARGCGAGSRVLLDRANVLRAVLIEPAAGPRGEVETAAAYDDHLEPEAATDADDATRAGIDEDDATQAAGDDESRSGDAAAEGPDERSDPAREPERETDMAEELPGNGAGGRGHDGHVLLETNVDDMSPELLAHAADVLREAGAVDVWMTPAVMKKGRQGTVLHVLAAAADRERLAAALFAETSTFGLRVLPVERIYAEERRETITVAGQTLGVRLGFVDGRLVTVSPEYEDVRAVATAVRRPAKVVYEAAQALARNRFSAG
jgi:pyridinium-3,5-bisthiocarboxylic acid mononucleotide nickel chelatase